MRIAHFSKLDGNVAKADQFLELFKNRNARVPFVDWIAFQAYDAANILIRSLKKSYEDSKSMSLLKRIRVNLLNGQMYNGVSGDITINVDGTSDGIHIGLYLIRNGKPIRD